MGNPYRIAAPKPPPDRKVPKVIPKVFKVGKQPKILCPSCWHLMYSNEQRAEYICPHCFGQMTHMEYQVMIYRVMYGDYNG